MTLTAADVAEIMRVIEQSKFDELNLEMDGVKLTLRRGGATGGFVQPMTPAESSHSAATAAHPGAAGAQTSAQAAVATARVAAAAVLTAAPTTAAALTAVPTAPAAPDANLKDIASPMLGTFYRAPKPGAAPFVEIGSVVDVDSVIGIIEVMKLMNTVRAAVRGVITEILPADEALVEFGEVLMRVRTDV